MSAAPAAQHLLELKDVSLEDGPKKVLRRIRLSVDAGENILVFGRSGSGIHALFKIVAGILTPSGGRVRLNPRRSERPLPLAYVSSRGGLINNLTLLQNAVLPIVYHRMTDYTEAKRKGRALLEDLGIEGQADRRPAAAGAGVRRLTQIARSILIEPELFVFDHPMTDVDAATGHVIRRVLLDIRKDRRAGVMLAVGYVRPFLDWADRFVLLRDGGLQAFEGRNILEDSLDDDMSDFID